MTALSMVTGCVAVSFALATPADAGPPASPDVLPFVADNCLDCHTEGAAEAGVMLDHFHSPADLLSDRDAWHRVLKQVRAGAMPPDGYEVAAEDRAQFVEQLERVLTYVDPTKPVNPGRVTARRLNRQEYDYTIRDLFGLHLHLSGAFPDDDAGYGFDNNGDVLTTTPLHLEQYLSAAEDLTDALFSALGSKQDEWIPWDQLTREGDTRGVRDGQLLRPGAAVSVKVAALTPGEYRIDCAAWRHESSEENPPAAVRVMCDGESLGVFVPEPSGRGEAFRDKIRVRLQLDAGMHTLRAEYAVPDQGDEPAVSAADLRPSAVGELALRRVGDAPQEAWPPAARALLFDRPGEDEPPAAAVRRIVETALPRFWRRDVTDAEVDRFVAFAEQQLAAGESLQRSLETLTQAILVSPEFLYRVDLLPEDPQQEHSPVSDAALASRLSYFLWCSAPDDELLELAKAARLGNEATLVRQVKRLMRDPRSKRFIESFFGQWLGLRKLDGLSIDKKVFRRVSSQLKADMRTETLLLAESIVEEDQSLMRLITADYSFINRGLARLYGIEGVRGEAFRRVPLGDQPRRGLLTHASVLTLTSYPNRTSPPRRGAWVLENLLGDEPPAPPADVPDLAETQANSPDLPLREQLELHRTDATCASCHRVMDAIGFGLENYNAIGQWREEDRGNPIDAAGDLPSGESFGTALELIDILESRGDAFADCVTRKMMVFALGRGLEYYDRIAVEGVVDSIREEDYRFSALVREVVLSRPFRMRRLDAAASSTPNPSPSTKEAS